MLNLLLKNRIKIIIFGFTKGEPKERAGRIIGLLVGIIFFTFIAYYSFRLNIFLGNILESRFIDEILEKTLTLIFGVAFIFVFFSGIATSLNVLYLSKDLDMLMGLPISHSVIFTYKFIEALIGNSYVFFIFILPFVLGTGITSRLPFIYYLLTIIIFLIIIIIPTGIGVITGMVVVRYINPNRSKEMIAVIGGFFGLSIFIGSQLFSRFFNQNSEKFDSMGIENTVQYIIKILDRPFFNYLPTVWGARALSFFHQGYYSRFFLNFSIITVLSIVLIVICILISKKLFYSGWSGTTGFASGGRKKNRINGSKDSEHGYSYNSEDIKTVNGGLFSRVNYLLIKDFKLLFRDIRKLLNIILPLVIFSFIFFQSFSGDLKKAEIMNFFISINTLVFMGFPLFITGAVITNISGNSIGGEGLSFWILKIIPVPARKIISIKIIYSMIIGSICGILITMVIYFFYQPGFIILLFELILILLFSWGCSTIGTTIGAFFPEFKPAYSRKSNTTFIGGLLVFFLFIIYLALFSGIIILMFYLKSLFLWPDVLVILLIAAIEFIMNIILYNILANISAYRINSYEWKY